MYQDMETLLREYLECCNLIEDPQTVNRNDYLQIIKRHGQLLKIGPKLISLYKIEKDLQEIEEIIKDPNADRDLLEIALNDQTKVSELREDKTKEIEKLLYIADPDNDRPVIIEMRAGTGGDEAALFAFELFQVYIKYCTIKEWELQILDTNYIPTLSEAYKGIDFRVSGEGAFSFFKNEGGGHRVQRTSPTDSQGRTHTSMVTVTTMPEYVDVQIEIDEKDLDISFTRSGGPGGQHQNKTDSRAVIKHIPTKIQVSCGETRSQYKNKARAMQILRNKLFIREKQKREAEIKECRNEQNISGDRSARIRTYNYKQNRCTDHRIKGKDKNCSLSDVLNGNLDSLVEKLSCK